MKTRILNIVIASVSGLVLALGCADGKGDTPEWPWPDPDTPDTPDTVAVSYPVIPDKAHAALVDPTTAGWQNVSAEYTGLNGVSVYKFTDKFFDRPAIAYIAVADASKTGMDIWSINDPELKGCNEKFKTPSEVYASTPAQIIVNGGYFYASGGKYYSASLAVSEGKRFGVNVNYASEDWVKIYYPTRAAFVEHADGKYEACWTYYSTTGAHYVYQNPAKNSWSKSPLAVPSATFPETAAEFEAVNAIGGGPVLLKNDKVIDSYVEELFNGTSGIGPDIYAPRTAVGISADSKLVLFVCEGRNMTEGVTGLTTGEVAKVLYSLGCKDAINLDGGGSSCMLVCGKETIKCSDGKQRSVASTVMFK